MKTGILGGTFNPVHLAHLRIGEEVRDRLGLDRVIFVPAAVPPHKEVCGDLAFEHRYTMVRLAIDGNPYFTVSDLEAKRGGVSYSIDTVRSLRGDLPEQELYFIIGSDSFLEFPCWREYAAFFRICNLVVVERPGAAIADLPGTLPVAIRDEFCYHEADKRLIHTSGFSIIYLEGVPLDISSSAIREHARTGRSIRYLLPDAVERYILERRIYNG